jgi:hypothetical protein
VAGDLHVSPRMRLILALAVVTIAACARGDTRDSTDSAPGDTVAPTPHVTAMGVGRLRIGMTVAEARQALDSLVFTDPDSMRCSYPKVGGLPEGVMVMVTEGVVSRVDVQKGDVATTEGVRIGDTETKVKELYGSKVTVSPHKYTDGRYLTVVPEGDTLHRIIFETNLGGTVLRYRAGKLPEVGWVESCS